MNKVRIIISFFLFLFFSPHLLLSKGQEKDSIVVVINNIRVIGNKITKNHIIFRELPFHAGDTISRRVLSNKLLSAKQNLLNTSLFNFVMVDTVPLHENMLNIFITVNERWYTWPVPIFEFQERNFNDWWERRDLSRANYGFTLNQYNFRGRKEELGLYAQAGYTVKYGISYDVPYLSRKQTSGMGFSFSYARNHEIPYMTIDNKQQFFKDPNVFIRKELVGRLKYYYRRNIQNSHYFEVKFVSAQIDDTVRAITIDYFPNNTGALQYFALDYSFTRDFRNSKQYPLKGYLLDFEVIKLGIGVLNKEKVDITNFFLTAKGYVQVANRIYCSSGLKTKISSTVNHPYYVQKGLGWRDYIRGYEYYVIDGGRYALAKAGLKYEIIKPHIKNVPLPLNKFNTFHYALYFGLYGDMGYVEDRLYAGANPLANSLLAGYGVGVDYVTYYDIVLRLECSMNKMNELGFFIHFNAGI